MRDDRIRQLATADELAKVFKHRVIFVFKSDEAKAIYLFGKRVYASKAWNVTNPYGAGQVRVVQADSIKHFDATHFTAVTIGGRKFLYCPVGNICSWSEGDYDHKWCEWCKKGFEELK